MVIVLSFSFGQGHDAPIRDMVWSKDEVWLLSADVEGVVRSWRPNLKLMKDVARLKDPINAIDWAPSDLKFVTASDDSVLRVWDFATARCEKELKGMHRDGEAKQDDV